MSIRYSRRTGLPVHLKILDVPNAVTLDQATCLFRVMQESVQNVVKHAQATTVTVQLRGSSKGSRSVRHRQWEGI